MEKKKQPFIPNKNLSTDTSPQDQPQNTTRFVLNAVENTSDGDAGFLTNEESNAQNYQLPTGYIPLGKVLLSDGDIAILSVSADGTTSEIGIADKNNTYTTHVNSTELGFSPTQQINAIYRLRRGCDRTIYWVDPKVRQFNFDSPDEYKTGGNWDANKFALQRRYDSIPTFNNVKVIEQGVLEPGSYNISIQYLDEDLNPTEWLSTSPIINIFNDSINKDYLDIRGSINNDMEETQFPNTNKAIELEINNLDTSFIFYRLAFIEATSGTGLITDVKFTAVIPTSRNFFVYTGQNYETTGTEDEILAFANVIEEAEFIQQIENRLILSNTKGVNVDFCKLQRFASKIKADVITKKVFCNTLSASNPKNPTAHFEGVGYMPGEIYSFGIMWVFDDGYISPVYHIPGKNPTIGSDVIFTPGANVFPMSNDNISTNNVYTDNATCSVLGYWGADSEGDALLNTPVRHHRFPTRTAIGKKLVKVESTSGGSSNYYQVNLIGSGTIVLPCSQEDYDAGLCDPVQEAPPFQARVTFTVDGAEDTMTVNINPANESNPFQLDERSNFYTSNNIVITKIEESKDDGTVEDVTGGGASSHGISYTASVQNAIFTNETNLYSTDIFGIQFSGIELPDLTSTNGKQVIGYYIVRNERLENEKTILDSGVITPCLVNDKYTAQGLLAPEIGGTSTEYSEILFGLINPEYKFNKREYTTFTSIEQQGRFNVIDRKKSKWRYTDVVDGTSYDSDVHKGGGGKDSDGWSLKGISRDNIVSYTNNTGFNKNDSDIQDIFYLSALESRNIEDAGENQIVAYNVSADNRTGMIHLKEPFIGVDNTLPYVYLRRIIADSYSTFRTLPFYKASLNIESASTVGVFGGDTYVTPMRYSNSFFWDNRIAKRAGRTSFWDYLIGAILIVVGLILSIFGVGVVVIAAGIAIIGAGALFAASGIKRDALVRAYYEEYEKGLRETLLDDWVKYEYKDLPCWRNGGNGNKCDTPEDDEIQWGIDCITDLWFESQVNMQLRYGFNVDLPTFMDAPGIIESGNEAWERRYEHFGIHKQVDESMYPFTVLDKHASQKLAVFDPERNDSRSYIGHALGDFYGINPDYTRLNSQKIYTHLPLEYDCCSACQEDFPHRNHYSEQSFQEELTDNYRVFLPNNYRDIEGEKGIITGVYRLHNNLFIHTQEALWQLPQNYQERVTGDIVSFLGTGSYFDTPPRRIMDSDIPAAGTKFTTSTIKTEHGIMYPSSEDGQVYFFNGQKISAISMSNFNWFKNNMNLLANDQFYNSNQENFPFFNNPSNIMGIGYISTYDNRKERLILTKKDFSLPPDLIAMTDYHLCYSNGQTVIFENFQATIDAQAALGWVFQGIENCEMVFFKAGTEVVIEDREILTNLFSDTDIHIFYDTSGSFGVTIEGSRPLDPGDNLGLQLGAIDTAVDAWIASYAASNPLWTGNLYKYIDKTERWLNYATTIGTTTYLGEDLSTKNIIVISFCNEAGPVYHAIGIGPENPLPAVTTEFTGDYNNFTTVTYPSYGGFIGIHYPIVFGPGLLSDDLPESRNFVLHSLAALKGTPYSLAEVNALSENLGFDSGEWDTLKTSLQAANPYPDDGLENYGWLIKEDRYIDATGKVIDSVQFENDINEFIESSTGTSPIQVEITRPTLLSMTIAGIEYGNIKYMNNSWTMSYSLKNESWVSWHSYLPSFYMNHANRFYSWINNNDYIYKHNIKGSYQNFYGVQHPHIIEYVINDEPTMTKIFDWFKFQTVAKIYDATAEEYVEQRGITHNKIQVYNNRQASAELTMVYKHSTEDDVDYLENQTVYTEGQVIIDNDEGDWNVNDLRDIVTDVSVPLFTKSLSSRQATYFIDKVLNPNAYVGTKNWYESENFRGKFLVVRLIFDNFDTVQLTTRYSLSSEQESKR